MASEEMLDAMRRAAECGGEGGHEDADELLVCRLRELGEDKLCDLWEQVRKWYS